ncbi:MAG: hypothetical protein LAP87_28190 [Acidobacteriia bacterium]|nr:hypothetical protein [Terriglobia bacterium]
MKRIRTQFSLTLAAALALFISAQPASAQTNLFGSLSNFDVFNDTGQQTHGFEIEIDGVSSQDLSFLFGAPYIRYGTPALVDFPGGVYVRYQSSYNPASKSFAAGTPVPPSITPTAGHSCWTGGAPGYLSSGCEHFGMGLLKTPTAVVYHWLIEDAANPGSLIPYSSNVNIPAPLWSVVPPAVAGAAPVVQAVLQAPKPDKVHPQFGDAVWVKVYETESPEHVELNHLLTDDPVVPDAAHSVAEVEWELLQNNPKKAGNGDLQHGKPLGKGNQSVIRRFEYYKFTGTYDPENHEARCSGGECKTPGPGDLGDYIGAQMAAAQLGPVALPSVTVTAVASATAQAGIFGIASGSWVSIYGTNLSANSRIWRDSDFTGNSLPMSLEGVSVKINGKDAAVYGVTPGQLNVQAPTDSALGLVQVQVIGPLGTATGAATLQTYAPGFFVQGAKQNFAAAVHSNGVSLVSQPAQPGEVVLVYGTGFGPTSPAVPAGVIFNGAAPLVDPSQVHIRIGGVTAKVIFAGLVVPGEYQFNVQIPALADGDYPIVADIGGLSTQSGLLISIRK